MGRVYDARYLTADAQRKHDERLATTEKCHEAIIIHDGTDELTWVYPRSFVSPCFLAVIMDAAARIAGSSRRVDLSQIHAQVRQHIDTHFQHLDTLLAQQGQSSEAGPSQPLKRIDSRRSGKEKQKRTLEDEIGYWTAREAAAEAEVSLHSSLRRD